MNSPACVGFFEKNLSHWEEHQQACNSQPGKDGFFFNIDVTSASFKSFGNSALIKQLLNVVFNASEKMVLVLFRGFFWGWGGGEGVI